MCLILNASRHPAGGYWATFFRGLHLFRGTPDIENELAGALQFHQSGQLDRAKGIYESIIKRNPNHSDALHLLGVLFHQKGDHAFAAALIKLAIRNRPQIPAFYDNLGTILRAQGWPKKAISCHKKALSLNPDYFESYFNIGNAYQDLGETGEAIGFYEKALSVKPDHEQVYFNLGNAFLKEEKLDKAISCYREMINLKPDYAEAWFNLGNAHQARGDLEEAVACFKKSLNFHPGNPEVYMNMGNVCQAVDNSKEALSCYQRALELRPDYAEAHYNRAIAFNDLGDTTRAISSYQKAIALNPTYYEAFMNLGETLKSLGRVEEGEKNYQQLLLIKPGSIDAYFGLSELGKLNADREMVASLKAIKLEGLAAKEKMLLQYTLGKMLEKMGDYDKAFNHFHLANRYREEWKGEVFDFQDYEGKIQHLMNTFDVEFFESRRHFGVGSELPVFIVGMPRSGTTLVEQILASHPLVYGAGELTYIRELEQDLLARAQVGTIGQITEGFDSFSSRSFAEQYLERIRSANGDVSRITDKLPGNFEYLWLISLMFPKAKIIHCVRDPMDTCLSCFFTHFSTGHAYKNDLKNLGLVYGLYRELMNHWHKVLPISILDVNYEDMVDNHSDTSRRVVEFCGLNWDDGCLEFFRNRRHINTASAVQVRQRIYKTSVKRWEKYKRHLTPLIEGLGDAHWGAIRPKTGQPLG